MFSPNSVEDEEPVGDEWLSLLIVTDTFEDISVFVTLLKKKQRNKI
jgi:hypothetical protein